MAWTVEYRADRRAHHHRCRACWKVIETGERATFFHPTAKSRRTWAIHEKCGDARHSPEFSWSGVIAVWEADRRTNLAKAEGRANG